MNSVHVYLDDAERPAEDTGFVVPAPLAVNAWESSTKKFGFPWQIRFFQHEGKMGAALWGDRLFSWAYHALVQEL